MLIYTYLAPERPEKPEKYLYTLVVLYSKTAHSDVTAYSCILDKCCYGNGGQRTRVGSATNQRILINSLQMPCVYNIVHNCLYNSMCVRVSEERMSVAIEDGLWNLYWKRGPMGLGLPFRAEVEKRIEAKPGFVVVKDFSFS